MALDVRRVRYFVAVARAGSLSAAARQLHVAQPSLSRQIRQLEAELRTDLFRREGGRLYLNSAGHRFLLIANDLLIRFELAAATMMDHSGSDPLRLIVVGNATTLNDVVAPFAATLTAGPILDLQDRPTAVLTGAVERAQADLALSALPSTGVLASRLLVRFPFYACVPPGHPWATRSSISLRELADQPLIVLDDRYATRRIFDHAMARRAVIYRTAFEVRWPQAAQALAAAGQGIAILTDEPRYGLHVLRVGEDGSPLALPMFAVWDPSHYARERIEALVEDLTAYCLRRFPNLIPAVR